MTVSMPISWAWPTPSATLTKVRPAKRSGTCTVCPAARSRSANAPTPGVSPCAWWNRTISAICSACPFGGGAQRADEQDLVGRAAQPVAQPVGVAAPAVPELPEVHLPGARLGALRRRQAAPLEAGDGGQAGAQEHQVTDVGQIGEQSRGSAVVVLRDELQVLLGAASALGGRIGGGHRTTVPRPKGSAHRRGRRRDVDLSWALPRHGTLYSTCRSGAPDRDPSYASAVRRPVPLNWKARALPATHPGRPIAACTRLEMSGVRCPAPATSAVGQVGGDQGMPPATGRAVIVLLPEVYVAGLAADSPRMVSDDAPVLTSSTWNCTQAPVTVAPTGTCTPGKRTPTTCCVEPSAISSRSVLVRVADPLTFCSASSEPEVTRTCAMRVGGGPMAGCTVTVRVSADVR